MLGSKQAAGGGGNKRAWRPAPLEIKRDAKIESGDIVQVSGYVNGDSFRVSEEAVLGSLQEPLVGLRTATIDGFHGSPVLFNDSCFGMFYQTPQDTMANKIMLMRCIFAHADSIEGIPAVVRGMLARLDSFQIQCVCGVKEGKVRYFCLLILSFFLSPLSLSLSPSLPLPCRNIGCSLLREFCRDAKNTDRMVKYGAIKALGAVLGKFGNRQSVAENGVATLAVFACSRDAYLKMVVREVPLPLLTQVMSDFLHLRPLQAQCFQMLDKILEKYRTKRIEICDIGAVVGHGLQLSLSPSPSPSPSLSLSFSLSLLLCLLLSLFFSLLLASLTPGPIPYPTEPPGHPLQKR